MTQQQILNRSGLYSLVFGAPLGIFTILFTLLLPSGLTGEGLFLMAFLPMNGVPIIALTVSFVISLWFAGRMAATCFLQGRKFFWVSMKYSLFVNVIIWPVFMLAFAIVNHSNYEWFFGILLPLVFFVSCIIISPFTIGFAMCLIIRQLVLSKTSSNCEQP